MLCQLTINRALSLIGAENKPVVRDTIIPSRYSSVSHSLYRPEYDWLFVGERKLFRLLSPWLESYRFDLIGDKGILTEALANAFCHGHQKNRDLPIKINVYVGFKGLIVQIKDLGKGFDVSLLYKNFRTGKQYYIFAGNGLRNMIDSNRFIIFFNQAGSIFHLAYLFEHK